MIMVAKKSSSNAIKKVDKQIKDLEKATEKLVDEKTPTISKKELQEKVKEATTPKKTTPKKKTNSNSKKQSTTKKTSTSASKSTKQHLKRQLQRKRL